MSRTLNASESVYGFCAWITTFGRKVVAGASHDAAVWADLAKTFCEENELPEVRDPVWPKNLTMPRDPTMEDEDK